MLKEHEVKEAIAAIENQIDHSPADCARLADLYSIQDHAFQRNDNYQAAYSQAATPVETALDRYGDSDFLVVVAEKMPDAAWGVMDDLMDTLRVVNPRVYESYMRKMRQL